MSDIKELEAIVERLNTELRAAQRSLNDARNASVGIAIGDIVTDKKGVEHQVTSISHWGSGRPWLKGLRRKANGEFGAARHLYSEWTKVSP